MLKITTCLKNEDCVSGNCRRGICELVLKDGDVCRTSRYCHSANCDPDSHRCLPAGVSYRTLKDVDDNTCQSDIMCKSEEYCDQSGICRPKVEANNFCDPNLEGSDCWHGMSDGVQCRDLCRQDFDCGFTTDPMKCHMGFELTKEVGYCQPIINFHFINSPSISSEESSRLFEGFKEPVLCQEPLREAYINALGKIKETERDAINPRANSMNKDTGGLLDTSKKSPDGHQNFKHTGRKRDFDLAEGAYTALGFFSMVGALVGLFALLYLFKKLCKVDRQSGSVPSMPVFTSMQEPPNYYDAIASNFTAADATMPTHNDVSPIDLVLGELNSKGEKV